MLIQLPNTGDWVNPEAVLRVQIADPGDAQGVHVVTQDGGQMSVPVDGDAAAVKTVRDQIAALVNNRRRHHP